jgi:hypothetical protein
MLEPATSFHIIQSNLNFIDFHFIEPYIHIIKASATGERAGMEQPGKEFPPWLAALDEEDWQFLKRFLLSSGSLKALASEYGVSYPTVRARLDRLIAKVQAVEEPRGNDPFERRLRVLAADARLPPGLAKELLDAHREALKKRSEK